MAKIKGVLKAEEDLDKEILSPPLLFVICMKYLSRMMQLMGQEREFKFHPQCQQLRLTHLMFAGDLIILSKVDQVFLKHTIQIMQNFHDCAGLKANIQKS